jgi:hypothetical protein
MGGIKNMYFTNISNPELQQFHDLRFRNFSISLTEILSSSLFQVETIIPEKLFKIYPLFYSNEIKCSNTNDKILDNRCIIANKNSNESYYSFISDDTAPIVRYNGNIGFFGIGDELSVDEFNSIVQLYRSKNFTEEIMIRNSLVNGQFGDYSFNLESTTIVDNGVLITKETLENIGTVRLLNPVFLNSNYLLSLKVYSVEDFNLDLSDNDNIIVTPLEIPLEHNVDVSIPFETLDLNNIVGFDGSISIDHNRNIVQYPLSLTVSSSTLTPSVNKAFELSCLYLDDAGEPLTDENITFKLTDETVLGTARTDSEGVAVLEYTPGSLGNLVVYCVDNHSNKSSSISLEVVKQSSNVTLTSDKSLVYIPGSFTVTGSLTVEDEAYTGSVKLMNNGVLLDTLETNRYGVFSKTINADSVSNYQLQVVFDGDNAVQGSTSSYVNIVARKLNTNLSINVNRTTVYFVSQNVTINGVLTDELGNGISGATITLNGESSAVTTTTNSSGAYSFTRSHSEVVSYSYNTSYAGDSTHNSKTSASKTVNYRKAPTSVTILNPQSEYEPGDTVLIKVSSNYGTFNPSSVTVHLSALYSWDTSTKDGNGNFIFTIPTGFNGQYTLRAVYYGDTYYGSNDVSIDINIVYTPVDTLTLSKSGNNFILNYKKNGVNVTGLDIRGTILSLSNPVSQFPSQEGTHTDNRGNVPWDISAIISMGFHGTAKFTFAGVTSNTLTY